jgi:Fic family protein
MDAFARVAALPEVGPAVDSARDAVDRLLRHRLLRRRSAEVTAESSLRGARASAALEGADRPLEELRNELLEGGVAPGIGAELVEGAVRLHAELGGLIDTWERTPRQALARMHVLAARGLTEDAQLGRPRLEGAPVADPLGLGPAPALLEVNARLDGLADLLVAPTRAPALVVAAVVHAEVLALRPFGRGDGLIARAASRLTLVGRGLDPKSVTAPEVGHAELAGEYADAARGYLTGKPEAVGAWVAHCARAVELGAREGLAVCEALQRGE